MKNKLKNAFIGDVLFGFKLVKTEQVKSLHTTVYTMVHEKTGAELIYSARNDDNKTFAIAFETLPENDTGVFHILEHSVLNGSKKYPVKEPFVNLLQGSMQTYLNAMTFGDKTVYPVSSRNDKDFFNLMSVYLDAVFNPSIYTVPEIFMQEGWHYDIKNTNEAPSYNGVVFSEMKGVFSDVDDAMGDLALNLTFPDNCYRYCSGGHPEHIPELTYEEFINTHKRFYHPSNAKIFLDGDMNVDDVLEYIDKEYLRKYDYRESDFKLIEQVPKRLEGTFEYQIANENEAYAHFAFTKILCRYDDIKKTYAANILCDYLAGSNEAPLKRAVLESGLAQDILVETVDGIYQPFLYIKVRKTEEKHLEEIKSVIQKAINNLLNCGIDKEALSASLERFAFIRREFGEPRGVNLCIRALDSWLYGGEPTAFWDINDEVEALRKALDGDYFEKLLAEMFGSFNDMSVLKALPSMTKGQDDAKKEQDRLDAIFNSWSEDERIAKLNSFDKMTVWQQTPDKSEDLSRLPKLSINDVEVLPKKSEIDIEAIDGCRVVSVKVDTNGIAYLNLYFSIGEMSVESIRTASVLASLLGTLATKNYSAFKLQNKIKSVFGKISATIDVVSKPGDTELCAPYFVLSASMLEENVKDGIELIREILCNTLFTDDVKIFESLLQDEYDLKQSLISSGHAYAVTKSLAPFSSEGALNEYLKGESFVVWFSDYIKAFDGDRVKFIKALEDLAKHVATSSRLTIGFGGNVERTELERFISSIPKGKSVSSNALFSVLKSSNESIKIPSSVAYSAVGHNLYAMKHEYCGSALVLSSLMSYSYLWNAVRVQGGAYGTGMSVRANGDLFCYSYRDPNVKKTVEVYRAMPGFIEAFLKQNTPIDDIIIGTVNVTDPLLSPKQRVAIELKRYLKGTTYEDICKVRKEVLETTPQDLNKLESVVKQLAENGTVCLVQDE